MTTVPHGHEQNCTRCGSHLIHAEWDEPVNSREAPYLYVDGAGNENVFVPSAQTNSSGTTWASGPTPGVSIPIDQLKSDLIGQCMGGREKCWKFQSADQIKQLIIRNKTEDSRERVFTIGLQLQAAKASGKYAAEARVEYTKTPAGWKIKNVGLLSLKKIE